MKFTNILSKAEWYEPDEKNVVAGYFVTSSMHGLQYLGKPKLHLCERVIWIACIFTSMAFGLYLILQMWERYQNLPIVTVLNPSPLSLLEVPFPAVTVCNLNNVKQSFVDKHVSIIHNASGRVTQEELVKAYAAMHDIRRVCIAAKTFATRFQNGALINRFLSETVGVDIANRTFAYKAQNEKEFDKHLNPIKTLIEGSQTCQQMILLCVWRDVNRDCSHLFTQISTDFGVCCSFNKIPEAILMDWKTLADSRDDPQVVKEWFEANVTMDSLLYANKTGSKQPRHQLHAGRSSGLSILLDPELDEYYCSNTDSQGFVVGLNTALDMPRMKDNGVTIKTRSEAFIGVRPEVTIADDSIKQFSAPKRRPCYFQREYKLAYYTAYTESNCIDECVSNLTLRRCGCAQFYMPRNSTDRVCTIEEYNCTEEVGRSVTRLGLLVECGACLPTCTSIQYIPDTTTLDIHQRSLSRLLKRYPQLNATQGGELSIVHIYLADDAVYPRLLKEQFGFIDLLSNSGGLLGLCMGFSALSFLELIYHFTIRVLFRRIRQGKKRNRGNVPLGVSNNASSSGSSIPDVERPEALTAILNKHHASLHQPGHLTFGDKDNLFTIIRTSRTNAARETCQTMLESDFQTPYFSGLHQ